MEGKAIARHQPLDEPRVIPLALVDPLLQQRQEQVRLALELRVHHSLRETGRISDLLQRRSVIAAREEHPPRSRQDELAVPLALLDPGQTRTHTIGIELPMVCEIKPRSSLRSRTMPSIEAASDGCDTARAS